MDGEEIILGNATKRCKSKCPACPFVYANFWKPKNCPECKYEIGGSYIPKEKKRKKLHPDCAHVGRNVYSVKTSTRGDRCFVVADEENKLCNQEKCKRRRALTVASSTENVRNFSCEHIKMIDSSVQNCKMFYLTRQSIEKYSGDCNAKDLLKSLLPFLEGNEMPAVVNISEGVYAVYGPPSSVSPLGYAHLYDQENSYKCSVKNCKVATGSGKQQKISKVCIHQHVVFCVTKKEHIKSNSILEITGVETAKGASATGESSTISKPLTSCASVGRTSTVDMNMNRVLPYDIPNDILIQARKMDAATILALKEGSWPTIFVPEETSCNLCKAALGSARNHPGADSKCYLLTNGNPYHPVEIKVKVCPNKVCKAMHQVWPIKLGLFNICDKVLVALEVLLELRELFKKGVPISSAIEAKLTAWTKRLDKAQQLSFGQQKYLQRLLYNGFYCWEIMTERSMDNVICGICGTIGQFYLGDGNQKNCCSLKGVNHNVKEHTSKESPVPLESFLDLVKKDWIERITFSNELEKTTLSLNAADVPPIIAPALRGERVYNSDMEKKSIYLNQKDNTSRDSTYLHKALLEGLKMNDLDKMDLQNLKSLALNCQISLPQNATKAFIIAELNSLYGELLHGNSPCHSFGKVKGNTGGFYHVVCRHGCTVASKFMTLQESVRDAADLYLSLKFPPTLFICDTPCGLARHMDLRCPEVSHSFWEDNVGCFEKPQLGKKPEIVNVPAIVPVEFREDDLVVATPKEVEKRHHPISGKRRYIVGDRFHAKAEPHKSPLCAYHDINLCEQGNTIKTSYQESENHRKNFLRLRSSTMQSFPVHFIYNFLMDYYHNEQIVEWQISELQKTINGNQTVTRDAYHRLLVTELDQA